MKRKSIEEIQNIVKSCSECELLSTSYESATSKLTFKCHCGATFQSTIYNFINKKYKVCKNCARKKQTENIKNRFTYEEVLEFVNKNSKSKLLSTEYDNANEKLKFKCLCGNEFYTSFKHFKYSNQRQCKICGYKNGAKSQSTSHEEFIRIVKEKLGSEYEVLSIYKNNTSNVRMLHKKCGREYEQRGGKIKQGQRCPYCYASKKRSVKDVEAEIMSICGDSLKLYKYNGSESILLECSCGNIFERTITQIRRRKGAFCPKCKCSYGIRVIEKFLADNNILYKREFKFDECKYKNKLPFDFYLPDYNMCIEYDGEQHFRPLKHWGGEDKFQLLKIRDSIKDDFCKKNNIKLLRISYKDNDCIEDILMKNMLISC